MFVLFHHQAAVGTEVCFLVWGAERIFSIRGMTRSGILNEQNPQVSLGEPVGWSEFRDIRERAKERRRTRRCYVGKNEASESISDAQQMFYKLCKLIVDT